MMDPSRRVPVLESAMASIAATLAQIAAGPARIPA